MFGRIRAAKPLGEADTAKATGSDVSVMYFKVKKQQSNSSWEQLMPLPHAQGKDLLKKAKKPSACL